MGGWRWFDGRTVWLTLLAAVLIPGAMRDARSRRILPRDRLLLLAPVVWYILREPERLVPGCGCGAVILLAGWLFYQLTGGALLGGGDIKLLAAAGLFLGGWGVLQAALAGLLLALIVHFLRERSLQGTLALGPYLALGIWMRAWFLKF